jgi:hypothetical protein
MNETSTENNNITAEVISDDEILHALEASEAQVAGGAEDTAKSAVQTEADIKIASEQVVEEAVNITKETAPLETNVNQASKQVVQEAVNITKEAAPNENPVAAPTEAKIEPKISDEDLLSDVASTQESMPSVPRVASPEDKGPVVVQPPEEEFEFKPDPQKSASVARPVTPSINKMTVFNSEQDGAPRAVEKRDDIDQIAAQVQADLEEKKLHPTEPFKIKQEHPHRLPDEPEIPLVSASEHTETEGLEKDEHLAIYGDHEKIIPGTISSDANKVSELVQLADKKENQVQMDVPKIEDDSMKKMVGNEVAPTESVPSIEHPPEWRLTDSENKLADVQPSEVVEAAEEMAKEAISAVPESEIPVSNEATYSVGPEEAIQSEIVQSNNAQGSETAGVAEYTIPVIDENVTAEKINLVNTAETQPELETQAQETIPLPVAEVPAEEVIPPVPVVAAEVPAENQTPAPEAQPAINFQEETNKIEEIHNNIAETMGDSQAKFDERLTVAEVAPAEDSQNEGRTIADQIFPSEQRTALKNEENMQKTADILGSAPSGDPTAEDLLDKERVSEEFTPQAEPKIETQARVDFREITNEANKIDEELTETMGNTQAKYDERLTTAGLPPAEDPKSESRTITEQVFPETLKSELEKEAQSVEEQSLSQIEHLEELETRAIEKLKKMQARKETRDRERELKEEMLNGDIASLKSDYEKYLLTLAEADEEDNAAIQEQNEAITRLKDLRQRLEIIKANQQIIRNLEEKSEREAA